MNRFHRPFLAALLVLTTSAQSHVAPVGQTYPIVTSGENRFEVCFQDSQGAQTVRQWRSPDGALRAELRSPREDVCPTERRSAMTLHSFHGLEPNRVARAVAALWGSGYRQFGCFGRDTKAECFQETRGPEKRISLELCAALDLDAAPSPTRCHPLGEALPGPMGLVLRTEPLERGDERGMFWVSDVRQLVFSTWRAFQPETIESRVIAEGFHWNTNLSAAALGDHLLVAAHLPGDGGRAQVVTWAIRWTAP